MKKTTVNLWTKRIKKSHICDDLFHNLRYFFRFGAIIGAIPFNGTFSRVSGNLKYRKWSFFDAYSKLVLTIIGFNVIFSLIHFLEKEKNTPAELVSAFAETCFYFLAFSLYLHVQKNARQFLYLIKSWNEGCTYVLLPDHNLSRDCAILSFLYIVSGMSENAIFSIHHFLANQYNSDTESFLELYFRRAHQAWWKYFPFSQPLVFALFASNKLSVYIWNYYDAFIALMSRAISYKFKKLYEQWETQMKTKRYDLAFWLDKIGHHTALCEITSSFATFLSPAIFVLYSTNIYFFCLQLHGSLSSDTGRSTLESIYQLWAFFHLFGKISVTSLLASKIHTYAHQCGTLIRSCPTSLYTIEVQRADLRINQGQDISFHGLKLFNLTKPFLLSIGSCIFTIEIVLLQS